jgi:hypothetical protein
MFVMRSACAAVMEKLYIIGSLLREIRACTVRRAVVILRTAV